MKQGYSQATCDFWADILAMTKPHKWRLLSRGLHYDTVMCEGCRRTGLTPSMPRSSADG